MQIDIFSATYKIGAYSAAGYTFFLGFASGAALTSLALNKLYLESPSNTYPNNYLGFNLKVSGIVGLSTGLLVSYLAAKVLLKN